MTPLQLLDRKVTTDEEITIAHQIIEKIEHNQITDATLLLQQLSEGTQFPKAWIQNTKYALKTGDWSILSESFINKQFIGKNGYFLFIAPHKLCQEQGGVVKLSAILGKATSINSVPVQQLEKQAIDVFGKLLQTIVELVPFVCIAACSRFNREDSEAFIVPESWMIPDSLKGPIINNVTQHRQRFNKLVRKNISRIFESETANLLLDSLADETIGSQRQNLEYQYHEAGHATGLGIKRKIQDNLLPTYWYGAIEEWRADSVEFDLAMRLHPIEEVGKLIAANFCLRFGIDSQRMGGCDFDTHASSGLITLEYLFRSGALAIKKGKLALREPNYQSLVKVIDIQRADAVSLTKQELSLEFTTAIFGCYQMVQVHQSTKEIFRQFVMGQG